MNIKEKIESLVSSKEEFDWLYNTDYIYIVKGNCPDDNGILEIEVDHWDWSTKLRGPHEGPAKVVNSNNNQDWSHGYAFGVKKENVTEFEKLAVLSTLSTGYRFEKINVIQERAAGKNVMFGNLFSEE
jgi:hypothetical protein